MIANVAARAKERQLRDLHSQSVHQLLKHLHLSCQFCAFAAKKRDAHAFEYAIDEIVQAVTDALPLGVTEVHMVGGLHPTLKKDGTSIC
jgi:aminodeoxyfutalosine synthase